MPEITITIRLVDQPHPAYCGTTTKLAEAEIAFTSGDLNGFKLIGFAIWTDRAGRPARITYPARQYTVNGERRSFALLRPVSLINSNDIEAIQNHLRDLILAAYAQHLDATAQEHSR